MDRSNPQSSPHSPSLTHHCAAGPWFRLVEGLESFKEIVLRALYERNRSRMEPVLEFGGWSWEVSDMECGR